MSALKIAAADGPIGAEITDIDVSRPLDDETFHTIDGAIDLYAVVVIRDQNLTAPALADERYLLEVDPPTLTDTDGCAL